MNLALLIEIFTFLSVTGLCIGAMRGIGSFVTVRRRLGAAEHGDTAIVETKLFKSRDVQNPFLKWVQNSTSIKDFRDRNKLEKDLALAGIERPGAAAWYVVARFGVAVGLPVLLIAVQPLLSKPMTPTALAAGVMLLCMVGLVGPRGFLDRRIRLRAEEMQNAFPDALDLMVVCVEAGLGLEAAFVRVGEEVHESHPRIAFEFGRLAQELSAGRSRPDALRAMSERIQVDSVRSFVALVIQTDALGVSIGQTLRTFSAEMREARLLRAEEKAARVPVLMTAPLVVCILPVILAALLLPAIIDVIRTLLPAMKGH